MCWGTIGFLRRWTFGRTRDKRLVHQPVKMGMGVRRASGSPPGIFSLAKHIFEPGPRKYSGLALEMFVADTATAHWRTIFSYWRRQRTISPCGLWGWHREEWCCWDKGRQIPCVRLHAFLRNIALSRRGNQVNLARGSRIVSFVSYCFKPM